MFRTFALTAISSISLCFPALAGDIKITDAYARSATPSAPAGAAFLIIENHGAEGDRLIGAASDAARQVQLHTHDEDDQGVLRMLHVEEGFELPAHGKIAMQRGGDHVMLMGLNGPLKQGESVSLTLIFENAGEMQIDVPVDLERKAEHGHGHGHGHGHESSHGHSDTNE